MRRSRKIANVSGAKSALIPEIESLVNILTRLAAASTLVLGLAAPALALDVTFAGPESATGKSAFPMMLNVFEPVSAVVVRANGVVRNCVSKFVLEPHPVASLFVNTWLAELNTLFVNVRVSPFKVNVSPFTVKFVPVIEAVIFCCAQAAREIESKSVSVRMKFFIT